MLGSFSKVGKTRVSVMQSLPAPVGGWNARDSVANMDEKDAVILDNWWPMTSDVMGRKGYTDHLTAVPAPVESLMVYSATAEEMFAVAGGSIYDATSAGAVGAAVVSGLSNSRWQHVNMTTAGGSFMYAVNGVDDPLLYDGAAWTAINGVSTPAITGVTTSTLRDVTLFKNRLWFTQDDTLTAWYLGTDAIGGTASPFPLNGVARRGGEIVSIGTWTLDAGAGVDDHWVAITNMGEVIVYKGTDPTSANTWALVGVWNLAAPLGQRCMIKYAGDLLISGVDGIAPLSKSLLSERVDPRVNLTDKIQGAMGSAADGYGSNFGWQMLFYPKGDMLILNVPVDAGTNQQQFAMNTITGSWARFKGIDANCWVIFNNEPYFGTANTVCQFWSDFSDESTNINCEAQQAFSYFNKRGAVKQFKMCRPILSSTGTPAVLAGLNVDYSTDAPTNSLNFTPSIYGAWDSGLWDTAIWGGGLSVIKNWQTLGKVGVCAAIHLLLQQQIETHWQATDFIYEPGGFIG